MNTGTPVLAADCGACDKKASEISEQEKQLAQNTEFLGKNRQYLAVLSAKEASKFIKVSGNIELILNRMDANKGRIKQLKDEMEKEGCDSCPKKP